MKTTKKVYNISYLDKGDELIDDTQIDENSKRLAWELFKEFGHTRTKGMYIEIEEVTED